MTRRDSTPGDEETKVVAPRFDERESATARPVVPIDQHDGKVNTKRATVRPSLRSFSRHLMLAWAVSATLAAGAFALYRSGETSAPRVAAPQPSSEPTLTDAPAIPQPAARRDVPPVPARRAVVPKVQSLLPSQVETNWQDGEEKKPDDDSDEEELRERARKEEKRRRKEEEKRREEAEEDAERALKEARKKAERLRDKMKDESRKSRLVGVID